MKTLERKYSKSERIVAKAKFSSWVFVRQLLIALVLGGIIAVLWIFGPKILGFVNEKFGWEIAEAKYFVGLKWAILGSAGFVLLLVILQAISLYSKELILTEDKVVVRYGVFDVQNAIIPLSEIRIVESKQRLLQRIVHIGDISIISDAEKPYHIKGIVAADRLTRRIMKQMNYNKTYNDRKIKIALTSFAGK
ncbi:MAG: PH domain-containing protein [Clostridia bacterium]|nr:PH domain-containing protein [Clostridia bacterium]